MMIAMSALTMINWDHQHGTKEWFLCVGIRNGMAIVMSLLRILQIGNSANGFMNCVEYIKLILETTAMKRWYHNSKEIQLSIRITKKQLTSDRVNQLLSEGFDLTCDNITFGRKASESIWNARLDELSEYKQMHGHINVSLDYASPYYDLGMWLREQHSLYSVCEDENGQTYLTMERIQKLEQLGLDWGSK
mmetsp:Transcript_25617/g.37554  ORF Transcript_25617/g.37554 Transcript_25617/m.37554 type:complete len:191 (-) Transcript_25617:256-828(-)